MTKARDLANLASTATVLATDSELSAAIAGIDLTPLVIEDIMDSK
jgi:hypothetical protein